MRGTGEPASTDLLESVAARLRSAGCVFAEDEARLLVAAAPTTADLSAMVDRRTAGFPLEHILGWVAFCSLRVAVTPGVFVPRRRTEFLAQQAIARIGNSAVVLDLCCGSGALGAAVLAADGRVELHAADLDPAAVRCARGNLEAGGGQVHEGNLYQALPTTLLGRVDVVMANAPYVPSATVALLPPEARLHEQLIALDGGPDGLDVLRRVIEGAPDWLAPGGSLLFETSDRQARDAVEAVARVGLIPTVLSSAELAATVVVGEKLRTA